MTVVALVVLRLLVPLTVVRLLLVVETRVKGGGRAIMAKSDELPVRLPGAVAV
jgi:hypothetical protein